MSMDRKVRVVSSDRLIFHTDYGTCRVSKLLRQFIDANPEVFESQIAINEVEGHTLNRVLWWMQNHRYETDNDLHDCDVDSVKQRVDSWDRDFLDTSCGQLVDVIKAANYLDISKLLLQCINRLADMINDLMGYPNRVQLIRQMFHMNVSDQQEIESSITSHIIYRSLDESIAEQQQQPEAVPLVHLPQRKLTIDVSDSEYAQKLSDLAEDYLDHRLHLNNIPQNERMMG